MVAPLAVLAATRAMGPAMPGFFVLAAFLVTAAGFWFGIAAGVLEGLYLALLFAPLLRVVDLAALTSAHVGWWRAGLFFVVLGLVAGAVSRGLRRRLADERANRQELARIHARSLTTFARLVAERDQPTAHHCERVAANVRTLGLHHGLATDALDALYWSGLLHDLGKISTPASILLKEGALTAEEYDVIKGHAEKGAEVLLHISDRFHRIAEGVRSHHERWDGSGYPAGLAGTEIPLFGRLLAVADVFEAMTAPRPYRPSLPVDVVLEHLREGAGTHFDREIVALFVDLVERGLIRTHDDGLGPPLPLETAAAMTGLQSDPPAGAVRAATPDAA